MIWTEGQKILKFSHALDFFKNEISKCKLRLFEPLKGELNKFFEFEFLLRIRYLVFKKTQKSSL